MIVSEPPAPVAACYLRVVSVQEFLYCRPLWETSKSSRMANSYLAKLNFDWKECQGYLCMDEASALLGNTSGFVALMKQEGPPAPVAGPFCASVCWCQRLWWFWKPALKACSFIGAGALGYCFLRRFCYEMEQNAVTSTAQEFAGSPNGRSCSTWLNLRLKFYYFFLWK